MGFWGWVPGFENSWWLCSYSCKSVLVSTLVGLEQVWRVVWLYNSQGCNPALHEVSNAEEQLPSCCNRLWWSAISKTWTNSSLHKNLFLEMSPVSSQDGISWYGPSLCNIVVYAVISSHLQIKSKGTKSLTPNCSWPPASIRHPPPNQPVCWYSGKHSKENPQHKVHRPILWIHSHNR